MITARGQAQGRSRPLIGLTCNPTGSGTADGTVQCPRTYIEALAEAGGAPVVLPPLAGPDAAAVAAVVGRLDGLLLIGGRDVHPRRYGQPPHPASEVLDPRRDDWDMRLLAGALARPGFPVLGICLGIQQLNVALGGSLVQHVPDLGGALEHRAPETGDRFHPVAVVPGSLLAGILQADAVEVTTRHHQAVDRVGHDLAVVARAPDGVIEAVEAARPGRFLLGVQWHPERNPESPASRALFRAFVQACAAVAAESGD